MEHKRPVILRRRFIPDETVNLSGDVVLYRDERLIVTRWRTIRPKTAFAGGVSYYFLDDSAKISRFYSREGEFLYWYVDIVDIVYRADEDTLLVVDLLLDAKIMPDGSVTVLDEDELEAALARGLITPEQHRLSRERLGALLSDIAQGRFPPQICREQRYW